MARWLSSLVAQLPSQAGKVVVVTGTTSGVGHVLAKEAARLGATVVCMNRSSSRSEAAARSLREAVPDGVFEDVHCDLMSFASVTAAGTAVAKRHPRIHVLCNNAGIFASTTGTVTEDGFNCTAQTNHLAHFLLTSLLIKNLEAGGNDKGNARIVNVSSVMRHGSPLALKYFDTGTAEWYHAGSMQEFYQQTKRAALVFSSALCTRLGGRGSSIKAVTVHPGMTNSSIAARDARDTSGWMEWAQWQLTGLVFKYFGMSNEDGACSLLVGCFDERVKAGDFYGPVGYWGLWGRPELIKVVPEEKSVEQIDLLWRASEQATKVKM